VIVLFGLSVVTFLLVRLLPGGPAQTLVGVRASPEAIARVNEQLGLSDPLPQQYLRYVGQLLGGNLGESFLTGASVTEIVGVHLAVTLQLIAFSVLLTVVLGVPLAAVAAAFRRRWPDHAVRAVAVVTFGFPSFWIGISLIALFGLRLGWFPSGGSGTGFAGRVSHLFLPALTMSLTFLAVVVRSMRASLAELLRADFVDVARLKGLPTGRVWLTHVLRLGIVPAVTIIGMNASYLLGTSAIVENVFAVDGLGQQLVAAVLQRDFLVVQGITLVFGVLVVLVSLTVEALQSWLDPRLRSDPRD
jgi:peptide/nickel transport system permease protein